MTRGRQLVAILGALGLVALLGVLGVVMWVLGGGGGDEGDRAATGPVKIGVLTSLTGPFSSSGVHVEAGMAMAANDVNVKGGADGRRIELIVVDDRSDPAEAIAQIERLHDEGVVAVAGTVSSDVGEAIAPIAEAAQIPLFVVGPGSDSLLRTDSRYTFRACLPAASMLAEPWADYAERVGHSRVGSLVDDEPWGQAFLAASDRAFGATTVELQSEVASADEPDFTTHLRNLGDFSPDLVLATGHPGGTRTILAQSAELGIDTDVAGAGAPLTAVMQTIGDTAINRHVDLSCADYFSSDYAQLASRYVTETDLGFMEDEAVAAHGVVTMTAEAAGAVGGDPALLATYLRNGRFQLDGMAYDVSWTEWGELAEATPLVVGIGSGPVPDGLSDAEDWWPIRLSLSPQLEPTRPGP